MNPTESYQVPTYVGANFDKAEFRINKLTEKPSSILVLTPGSGGDGRMYVRDLFWTNWAQKQNMAIVGVKLTDVNPKIDEDYVDAKSGTGQALNEALDAFGVADLPLLMFGHSAGGGFNYEYACAYPQRVAAFVVNKGGVYYTALAPALTRAIPALWFVGMKDADYRINILTGLYSMNQTVSQYNNTRFNWEWHVSKYGGHEIAQSEMQAQDFFAEVIKSRGYKGV